MDSQQLRNILESCLLVAGKAMSIAQLEVLFEQDIDRPDRGEIKDALVALQQEYEGRGIELVEVATGWRLQSSASMEHWVGRLLEERAPRYSRALLETLVLIAYRQPITRGEIEEVRGVAVSSNIMRTLQERDWIKEMGFKDVPGKPSLWGTTKDFLDYFNLKRLDELPTLAEARDLAEIDAALAAEVGLVDGVTDSVAANDSQGVGEEGEVTLGECEDRDVNDITEIDENSEAVAGFDNPEAASSVDELETGEVSSGGDSDSSDPEDDSLTNVHLEGDFHPLTDAEAESELNPDQSADDAPQGSDLVSLAANLNRRTDLREEPDLGALVDGFDEEVDNDDPDKIVEHDAQSTAELSTNFNADSTKDLLPDAESNAAEIEHIDESVSGVEGNDRPSTVAMEVSAHDLDIDEWKEPATRASRVEDGVDSNGTASDHSSETLLDEVATTERNQAETDLRRVIDDFAEEHRQQLAADNDLRSNHNGRMNESDSADDSGDESVSAEGNGVALKHPPSEDSGGLSGSEGWQASDSKSNPGNDDDGQRKNLGNSGEP